MANKHNRLVRVSFNHVFQHLNGFVYQNLLTHVCFIFAVMVAMTSEVEGNTSTALALENPSESCETLGRVTSSMEA